VSGRQRWTEHTDHPCSITEHHAHEALGSSSLRRYLSDQQPTKKVGHLGNAVGWLATTPERLWHEPGAAVVQRPHLNGYPGGIAGWEAEHPGVIGLAAREYGMAVAMASSLREHPRLRRILTSSAIQIEHTVLARHVETGVRCKSRPDLRLPGVWLSDLKITRSVDLVSFGHTVGDYGYDAQAWLYSDIEASRYGLERLTCGYDLIVVTETAPHRVGVWSMPQTWLDRGRRLVEAALQLRRIHEETCERPPLWWERPQYIPDPSRTDRERERRISDHVDELLRLRDREDARGGLDGPHPRGRTA
jgi:PDDEXK-like domain of unknown function (DUF3799)